MVEFVMASLMVPPRSPRPCVLPQLRVDLDDVVSVSTPPVEAPGGLGSRDSRENQPEIAGSTPQGTDTRALVSGSEALRSPVSRKGVGSWEPARTQSGLRTPGLPFLKQEGEPRRAAESLPLVSHRSRSRAGSCRAERASSGADATKACGTVIVATRRRGVPMGIRPSRGALQSAQADSIEIHE